MGLVSVQFSFFGSVILYFLTKPVRLRFFGFRLMKSKLNRTKYFFKYSNLFIRFFHDLIFSVIFFGFLGLICFSVFLVNYYGLSRGRVATSFGDNEGFGRAS